MENLPRILFNSVLNYATNDKSLLKKVVAWERVSTQFSNRLVDEFWPTVQNTHVQFFGCHSKPVLMRIGSEVYESLDLSVLRCFRQRGMRRIRILFSFNTFYTLCLPLGFAASVPGPVSIEVGHYHNLNDPELLTLLQMYGDVLEGFALYETNETLSYYFVNTFLTFKSLKQITLCSWIFQLWDTPEMKKIDENRKHLYTNLLQLQLQCLVIMSFSIAEMRGIYDNELFILLEETRTIKCFHFTCLNHYVERWLANTALHNRAQITNLCMSNDHFGYHLYEHANRNAPLFHTVADYQLLFPKLRYLCISICLVQLDGNQLESMLMCYFENSSNIKIHLTVRLFHKLQEIPVRKLDHLNKLQSMQAEISIVNKTKRDGVIKIRSKNGRISSEIIVCFDENDIAQRLTRYVFPPDPENQKCVDCNHCVAIQ